MLGGTVTALDFYLSGSVASGTDKSARIRAVSSSQVSFYDNGTSTYSAGDEVLRWTCSATAASRVFDFKVAMTAPFLNGFSITDLHTGLALTNAWAIVIFASAEVDPSSAYNAATGVFTAPLTGYYRFFYSLELKVVFTTATGQAHANGAYYKNGVINQYSQVRMVDNLGAAPQAIASSEIYLNLTAGDTIDVRAEYVLGVGTVSSATVTGSWGGAYLGT